jgi:hypothetical protein
LVSWRRISIIAAVALPAALLAVLSSPVGVSLSMRRLAAPALVKFRLAACALCFFAAGALLAAPPVRHVV